MNTMEVLQLSSHQALLSVAELEGPGGGVGKSDSKNLKREAIGFILKAEGALRYLNHEDKEVTVASGFFATKTVYLIPIKRVWSTTTTIADTDILLLYGDRF